MNWILPIAKELRRFPPSELEGLGWFSTVPASDIIALEAKTASISLKSDTLFRHVHVMKKQRRTRVQKDFQFRFSKHVILLSRT